MWFRYLLRLFVGLGLLISVPGCGGCRKEIEEDEEQAAKEREERAKKEKEKTKDPFEFRHVATRPNVLPPVNHTKPGHWLSLFAADFKANREDFAGQWETEAVTSDSRPVPLVATAYALTSCRPIMLAKGQAKSFESLVWVPPTLPASYPKSSVNVHWALINSQGLRHELEGNIWLLTGGKSPARMPSYQYHMVVLARWPGRYSFLGEDRAAQNWSLPAAALSTDPQRPCYVVLRPPSQSKPELPSHALYWTSIAYLLWDDAAPGNLDLEQQQALLDWLHWGGQLLISGPDTLDGLKGSFLGPYLPATSTGTRKLAQEDFAELLIAAALNDKPLGLRGPLSGVQLAHDPACAVRGTGGLLVERAVGRGRIVVSAFRLSEPALVSWQGYGRAFNAFLLRRLPSQDGPVPVPAVSSGRNAQAVFDWPGLAGRLPALDARENSKLRYFTRDENVEFEQYAVGPGRTARPADNNEPAWMSSDDDSPERQLRGPGVGAWNDFSPVAQKARQALAQAAGINVPDRSFVFWVVAGYLVVLVPVNWALFRAVRRVEWAWLAAPLIAIGCTVLVIHLAQLNIGFARAQNEIAVVELQEGYGRAHVTRYTSLYTSLATRYEVQLDDPGAQVLPFPKSDDPNAPLKLQPWESYKKLVCRRAENTSLSGFSVDSNLVDYLHSEELVDVGGGISLQLTPDRSWQIVNRTRLALLDAILLRRVDSERVEAATPGPLAPGATMLLEFRPWRADQAANAAKGSESASPRRVPSGELSFRELYEFAQNARELRPGQARLVAAADGGIPRLAVIPAAGQWRQVTLVVAHFGQNFDGPYAQASPGPPAAPGVKPTIEEPDETADP
jgi:hypothetical protein